MYRLIHNMGVGGVNLRLRWHNLHSNVAIMLYRLCTPNSSMSFGQVANCFMPHSPQTAVHGMEKGRIEPEEVPRCTISHTTRPGSSSM